MTTVLTRRPRPSTLHTSYAQELAIFPTPGVKIGMAGLALLAIAAPFMLTDFWLSVINFSAIASIGAIGLNLLIGYTGQISLGHAFFIGLGAYTAAYVGGGGLPGGAWTSSVIVWLPMAGVLGAIVGGIIGPFALRLKGLYLAIVTLGLVFLGEHLFLNMRFITAGARGRSVARPEIGEFSFFSIGGLSRDQSFYFLAVPVLVVLALLAKNLVRSRAGRAFQSIRDREIAASLIGVNLFRYKVAAFVVSSAYAAMAGALFGSYSTFIRPGQFNLFVSIEYVAIIIVGGIATIFGSILGAFFITAAPRLIEQFSGAIPFLDRGWVTVSELNQMLFGILIIVFLVFQPYGFAGLWRQAKIYFKTWPFSY